MTLDGIFRAGLYQYAATGELSLLSPTMLRYAYVNKEDRELGWWRLVLPRYAARPTLATT